jgi:hypothetical protein
MVKPNVIPYNICVLKPKTRQYSKHNICYNAPKHNICLYHMSNPKYMNTPCIKTYHMVRPNYMFKLYHVHIIYTIYILHQSRAITKVQNHM